MKRIKLIKIGSTRFLLKIKTQVMYEQNSSNENKIMINKDVIFDSELEMVKVTISQIF